MTPTEQDNELRRAIVNYRIKCDYYLSDRDEGVISQEEYEAAISGELDTVIDLINTQKRLYAESVLDEVLVAIDKNIEASKGNLKYARDHNNSDRTIANWKGCIEGEKFIKDDVMRLRAEQRARIK